MIKSQSDKAAFFHPDQVNLQQSLQTKRIDAVWSNSNMLKKLLNNQSQLVRKPLKDHAWKHGRILAETKNHLLNTVRRDCSHWAVFWVPLHLLLSTSLNNSSTHSGISCSPVGKPPSRPLNNIAKLTCRTVDYRKASAVAVGERGPLAWLPWVECVPDSHWFFSCVQPNATGELCVTMTNHSLMEVSEGGPLVWENPLLQSAVAILRVPTCVFMLVPCWRRLVCCCCANSLHCLHRENESVVADWLFFPPVPDVLHSSALSLLCPCMLVAVVVHVRFFSPAVIWRAGLAFLFCYDVFLSLFFFSLGICDSYPWRRQSALLSLFFFFLQNWLQFVMLARPPLFTLLLLLQRFLQGTVCCSFSIFASLCSLTVRNRALPEWKTPH